MAQKVDKIKEVASKKRPMMSLNKAIKAKRMSNTIKIAKKKKR